MLKTKTSVNHYGLSRVSLFVKQTARNLALNCRKPLVVAVMATGLLASACSDIDSVPMAGERGAKGPKDTVEHLKNIGTKENRAYETTGAGPSLEIAPVVGKAKVPDSAIAVIYSATGGEPIWSNGRSWTANAKTAHATLSTSWAHGLQPNSYLPNSMKRLGSWNEANEVALTAGVIKYISDVKNGRTRPAFDVAARSLLSASQSGAPETAMAQAQPQDFFYQRIKTAALKSLSSRGAKTPNFAALETTMEKLRTEGGPSVDGTKILVNIAAFDLQAWKNNEMVLGSKIIVGQEGRATPIGPDKIVNLKFSPDWNAPRSIVERDLFPKLQENPKDFTRFGNEVYLNNKRVVDPTLIDWTQISPKSVRIRQAPGPDNVLGGVRFTLANSNAIYLHDTAHKALFSKIERAASSGCVRVAKSKEFAHWLFQNDGQGGNWPMSKVEEAMKLGDTQIYHLRDSVPLEMVYYTAWVDESGALSLSRDLYNKNAGLTAQLALN